MLCIALLSGFSLAYASQKLESMAESPSGPGRLPDAAVSSTGTNEACKGSQCCVENTVLSSEPAVSIVLALRDWQFAARMLCFPSASSEAAVPLALCVAALTYFCCKSSAVAKLLLHLSTQCCCSALG